MTIAERKRHERETLSKDYSNVVEIPPDNPDRQPPGKYPLMITGQRMQGSQPRSSTPIPAKSKSVPPSKAPNSLNAMDNFNLEDELDDLDEGVNESFEDDEIDPRAFLTDEMLEKLHLGESITITPFPAASVPSQNAHQNPVQSPVQENDPSTNKNAEVPGQHPSPIDPQVVQNPSEDNQKEEGTQNLPPITLPFTANPADLTRTGGPPPTEPVPEEPNRHPHHDHGQDGPEVQQNVQQPHPILPKIPDHIHYIPAQQLQLPTQIATQVSSNFVFIIALTFKGQFASCPKHRPCAIFVSVRLLILATHCFGIGESEIRVINAE